MATASIKAPGGKAAGAFLQERFGIQWGPDVYGIAEDGFTAESLGGTEGTFTLTLIGRCTRADVDQLLRLLWSKADPKGTNQ